MTCEISFGGLLRSHVSNTVEAWHDCAHIKRGGVFLVADMAPPFQFPTRTRLHQDVLQVVFVPFVQGDARLCLDRAPAREMREDRAGPKGILERRPQRAASPALSARDDIKGPSQTLR